MENALNQTAGYEDANGVAVVRFNAADIPDVLNNLIGLRSRLTPDSLEMFDIRFGIRSKDPFFSGKPEPLTLTVPAQAAVCSFEASDGRRAAIKGEFRAVPLPPPLLGTRASFISPHFVANINAGKLAMGHGISKTERFDLPLLEQLAAFLSMLDDTVHFRLIVDGKVVIEEKSWQLVGGFAKEAFCQTVEVIRVLESLGRGKVAPEVSFDDIFVNIERILQFIGCISPGESSLPAVIGRLISPVPVIGIIGYASIALGEGVFGAIVQRPLLRHDGDPKYGGGMVFGDPTLVESWARRGDEATVTRGIETRFTKVATRRGPGLLLVNKGNLFGDTRNAQFLVTG